MRKDKIEVEQAEDGQWYWHYRRSNGKIMADGSQGYARAGACERAAAYVLNHNELPDHPPIVRV